MTEIYDIESYQPRRGLGYLVNRVRGEMLSVVDRELSADPELGPLEVSSAQFVILASLSQGDKKSASDLCKGISYDAGAMTRMIDRLEDKGLLKRARCPNDRRMVYLELTDAGKAAFPRMRAISIRVLNRFLRGFSKAEATQLEAYLLRMLENAPPGA